METAYMTILIVLSVLIIVLLLSASITHGISGRFIYVDKRRKNVTLHLAIFGTPRNPSKSHRVKTSFRNCMRHLKSKGYSSVSLQSHLIDEESINIIHRIARMDGYKITNIKYSPTPTWQRFFIPFSMLLLRFKWKKANSTSCSLDIIL